MTAPTVTDPFSAPKVPFAGQQGPALRCIGVNRLVVIVPKMVYRQEPNPFFRADKAQDYNNQPLRDRLVCDLIVVSGQPFMYGGNPTDPDPSKQADREGPFPVPGVIFDYEIIKQSIVDSINPTDVGGGAVIGYLHQVKTKSGNSAWNFGNPPAPGSAERNAAIEAYNRYAQQSLPTHKPTAPVANPVQPAYTAPNGAMTPHAGQPTQIGAWPNQPQAGMGGAMAPVSAIVVPTADWTLSQQPVMGLTTEQWHGLAMGQREQMLQMAGVQRPTGY